MGPTSAKDKIEVMLLLRYNLFWSIWIARNERVFQKKKEFLKAHKAFSLFAQITLPKAWKGSKFWDNIFVSAKMEARKLHARQYKLSFSKFLYLFGSRALSTLVSCKGF